jgi:hypothetical protein
LQKIYLVEGHSGEYEEFRTWIVKAFYTKKKANEYKLFLLKKIQSLVEKEGDEPSFDAREKTLRIMKRVDSNITYFGAYINYFVIPVRLEK